MELTENVKKNNFVVSIILGLIALGFALSTCDKTSLTSNHTIASVDGDEIPYSAYAKQMQQLGAYDLTPAQRQQLPMFGKNIVQRLIDEKLLIHWGEQQGISSARSEVAENIKQYPYFQNEDKKFDINKYKMLLQQNQLTTKTFESQIADQITRQKAAIALTWYPVSSLEAQQHFFAKNTGAKINLVRFINNDLKKLINISPSELNTYLAKSENIALLKNLYQRKLSLYDLPETRKVSMFSMAIPEKEKKDTLKNELAALVKQSTNLAKFKTLGQDFAAKDSDNRSMVDLGWLSKGRLDKEVDEQIFTGKVGQIIGPLEEDDQFVVYAIEEIKPASLKTFEMVKSELAEEQLKNNKQDDVKKLSEYWSKQMQDLLTKNKENEINNLKNKFEFTFEKNLLVTSQDNMVAGVQLTEDQHQQILKLQEGTLVFNNLTDVLVITKTGSVTPNDPELQKKWETDKKSQVELLENQLGSEFAENIVKKLREKAKISIQERLL